MAKCLRCNKSAGLFAQMCTNCERELDEKQKLKSAALAKAQEESKRTELNRAKGEYDELKRKIMLQKVETVKGRIHDGKIVILYENIYLPVDSVILDDPLAPEFSIGDLRRCGFEGWDIVSIIPRTTGIALLNTSLGSTTGKTWGAGIGGNVAGVHIILKKTISAENIKYYEDIIPAHIERHLEDFMDSNELATMLEMQKLLTS